MEGDPAGREGGQGNSGLPDHDMNGGAAGGEAEQGSSCLPTNEMDVDPAGGEGGQDSINAINAIMDYQTRSTFLLV